MSIHNAKVLLQKAQTEHYAVGSFSPRNTVLIQAVLDAAEESRSPVLVQISANEFKWFDVDPKHFADAFYAIAESYTVPICLHLDHTQDLETIKKAIEAGFTSVMIDASRLPFEENIALTKEVVDYAHRFDVSVEAELGQIGGTDKLETGHDSELYTKPEEAKTFIERTGVDMLAVSVGTAHGVYKVKNPAIQFDILSEIRSLTSTPLVLHGGSGLPADTMHRAIREGICKINIATDLELAFHQAIGWTERKSNAAVEALADEDRAKAIQAVKEVVKDRMENYVLSAGRA
jgi:ketose-bisphosphate aldolase